MCACVYVQSVLKFITIKNLDKWFEILLNIDIDIVNDLTCSTFTAQQRAATHMLGICH